MCRVHKLHSGRGGHIHSVLEAAPGVEHATPFPCLLFVAVEESEFVALDKASSHHCVHCGVHPEAELVSFFYEYLKIVPVSCLLHLGIDSVHPGVEAIGLFHYGILEKNISESRAHLNHDVGE